MLLDRLYGSSLARWGWRGLHREAPWPMPLSSSTQSCHLKTTSRMLRLTGVAPVVERTA